MLLWTYSVLVKSNTFNKLKWLRHEHGCLHITITLAEHKQILYHVMKTKDVWKKVLRWKSGRCNLNRWFLQGSPYEKKKLLFCHTLHLTSNSTAPIIKIIYICPKRVWNIIYSNHDYMMNIWFMFIVYLGKVLQIQNAPNSNLTYWRLKWVCQECEIWANGGQREKSKT